MISAAFISAAIGGIWSGLKKVRETLGKDRPGVSQTVVSASIIESVTLSAWSDSNRGVSEAVKALTAAIYDLRNANVDVCRDMSDLRHSVTELRHRLDAEAAKHGG